MRTKFVKGISFFVKGAASLLLLVIAMMIFGSGMNNVHAAIQPVAINASNFPDPVFRSVISGSDYDRDGNGILDENEIGLTLNIYCNGMGVRSLKGVEYFEDLQGLWCRDNQIDSIDVTNLKDLRGLWCSNNPISSLDLTQNPELVWVYCYDCNLTALDVSHNPKMAYIECNTNPIPVLDVSHNPELEHLTCGSCLLTSLDVSHNPNLSHLDAFRNKLTSLDVSNNPKMKRLDIWDNPGLGSIDISHNPGLQYYNCANNDAYSIDVSHNPELNKLICSYNNLSTLDVSHNPKLVYLDCADNNIADLDLSNNQYLRFLQAFINEFTTLNIGNNPFLIKTYNEGCKQYEYPVCYGYSWTIDYGIDDSTGGDSIYFLCFDEKVTLNASPTKSLSEIYPQDNDDDISDMTDLITREVFVWTLYNMAGCPSVAGHRSRFSDVQAGAWYEDALIWGEENNICVGYPYVCCDEFGVGKWIKRQDVALMLMRFSEYAGLDRSIDFGRSDEYIDYYDIDYDHWEAMCWSATYDIVAAKGNPGDSKDKQRLDPLGQATRDECEKAIKRLLEVNGRPVPASISFPESTRKGKPEYIRNFVSRFYVYILDREAEPEGLENWTRALEAGTRGGADVADEFVHSMEYQMKNDSDEEYIDRLYRAFFDREPDAAGKAAWMQTMAEGKDRDFVLDGFLASDEYRNLCLKYGIKRDSTRTFVKRFYTIILDRTNDNINFSELDNWQLALDSRTQTGADIADNFIHSDEYNLTHKDDKQYLEKLYKAFFNRGMDDAGYALWTQVFAEGKGRDYVLNEFLKSEEFKLLCVKYGIKSGR